MLFFVALLVILSHVNANFDECKTYTLEVNPKCLLEAGKSAMDDGYGIVTIEAAHDRYFYFTVTEENDINNHILSLSTYTGNPDLYVTKPSSSQGFAREPTTSDSDYSSATSDERDVVVLTAELTPGTYVVLLKGDDSIDTACTLTLSLPNESVDLSDGQPFRDTAYSNQTEHFKWTPTCPNNVCPSHVTFIVTALSGDPDLVVSRVAPPTRQDFEHRSQVLGGDALTEEIQGSSDVFYIGVYGYRVASTFQITVEIQGEVTMLVDGVTQDGEVSTLQTAYYKLMSPSEQQDVEFSILTLSGSVNVYVIAQNDTSLDYDEPSPHHWDWAMYTYSGRDVSTLQLLHSEPSRKFLHHGGQYNIAVYGRSGSDIRYSLTAVNGYAVVTLRDGIPMEAQVTQGEFEYYMIHVNDPTQSVFIDVTSNTGDCDAYVSCDIDNTGDRTGTPGPNHNIALSISYFEDTIVVGPRWHDRSCNGTYYISVQGFSSGPSTYRILASIDDGQPVTLLNGIPITGIVPANEPDYLRMYQFYVPPDVTHLETLRVSVTPRMGTAEVYISTDGQLATRNHFDTSNVDNGFYANSIDVPTCFDCIVSIGVGSNGNSAVSYSISAVTSYSDVELQEGVPTQDHVTHANYLYYSYEISSHADGVIVVVSPSSGDPDLVCSTISNGTHPSMSDSGDGVFKARDFGLDQIHLDSSDIQNVSTLYCAVYGFSETSYSIVASEEYDGQASPIVLIPGQPQEGTVSSGEYSYYRFNVLEGTNRSVTFTAVPITGDVKYFVSTCTSGQTLDQCTMPSSSFKTWYSEDTTQQTALRISRADPHYCTDCIYLVGVTTDDTLAQGSNEHSAHFALTAAVDGTTVLLQDRVPFRATISADDRSNVYMITVSSDSTNDVYISLSCLSGDADLYVSMCSASKHFPSSSSSCITHPDSDNFYVRALRSGSDALTVSTLNCRNEDDTGTCRIYVAVDGWSDASYTIMASMHRDYMHALRLAAGLPQTGQLNANEIQYYAFALPSRRSQEDVVVNLQSLSGDADMKISLDGSNPSQNPQYQGYSVNSDRVVIRTTDAHFQSNCVGNTTYPWQPVCTIIIAVNAYAPQGVASYSLVVSQASDVITLQSGVPYSDDASSTEADFYVLTVDRAGAVQVTLTGVTGESVAYVSHSTERPDSSNKEAQISSTSSSSRALTLCDAVPCTYYISVIGLNGVATYSILAEVHESQIITTLPNGQAISGQVNRNEMTYYQVDPGGANSIHIGVTTVSGDVTVFVRKISDDDELVDGVIPVPELLSTCDTSGTVVPMSCVKSSTYDYHSMGGSTNEIDITVSSDSTYFTIGVYGGGSSSSEFSIYASSSTNRHVNLREGVAIPGTVSQRHSNYYSFAVTNDDRAVNRDLRITVTTMSGDSDLYVSFTNPEPSRTNYTMKANSIFEDTVTIADVSHRQECATRLQSGDPCVVFLTVYGFRNSTYSILASYANSFRTPTILSQGQPQSDIVRASSYQYYTFSAHYEHGYTSDEWVTISVQSQQGDPDLYVKIYDTEVTTDTTEAPSKTNKDYSSIAWHSDELDIPSPNDECDAQCGSSSQNSCTCIMNIAVYGASAQVGISNSSYTIVASGSTSLDPDSVEQLQSGVSRERTIENNQGWAYFMFTVSDPEVDVTISVQPTYGDPDLYVIPQDITNPTRRPTKNDHTWFSSNSGSDTLEISHTDLNCASTCHYIVGVYAFAASQFTILAEFGTEDLISIADGRAQIGQLQAGQSKTYVFRVANDNDNVDIAFALNGGTSGTLAAYVNAMQEASLDHVPSPTDYTWASNNFNAGGRGSGVEILSTDTEFSDARVLLITLTCEESSCIYTITASTEMEHTVLQLGGTAANVHFIAAHSRAYFKVYLPDKTKDLMISLTALDGDPDLFISREPFPECGGSSSTCSACWAAQGLGNETIVIDHSNPCETNQATNHCEPDNYDVGDYFIAVYGFRDSSFTVFASIASEPIQLSDSVPQSVHTVLQSPFPGQTSSQALVLGFCAESPIPAESASPMVNIDSKSSDARLDVDVYVCSASSPSGACADTNTGKLSDMHPIVSGRSSAAWIGSFTVESYQNSGSMILNRTMYESVCSNSPCHFSIYVYGSKATTTSFRVAFVKSGVRFVTLSSNQATAFPGAESGDILEAGSSRTYAMYVPRHEHLSVSLETCSGGGDDARLLLCGASSCSDPFNPSVDHGALLGPKIDVQSAPDSMYYATVSSSSEMSFQLKVGSGTARDVWGPMEQTLGEVQVEVSNIQGVKVSWSTNSMELFSSYEVYRIPQSAQTESVNLNTVCGMHEYDAHNLEGPYIVSSNKNSYLFEDGAFIPNIDYEFVVFAVPLNSPVDGFKASFKSASVKVSESASSGTGTETVGIIVGVVVVTCLVLAAIPVITLYRRTQRLEERLQYEMQDVRNVAGLGGRSVPKDGRDSEGYGRIFIDDGGDGAFDEEAMGGFQPME